MANNHNIVVEIDATRENWKLCVRVVRLWLVPNFKNKKLSHSLEMVLVNSHMGGFLQYRIHTTVKRTLVYKFQNEIKKGKCYSFHLMGVASNIGGFKTNHHPYKLIFQFSTKVILLEDGAVPNIVYDLVPISTIMDGGLDVDYLVGKVALLNSINFDLIIISTIMLL
ncbi:hypothetical protein D0Y65_030616 [Glycine soja]|uniref:Replication protein A 70 kDa DNA-binding subunit B/D first OB fold domain-containing protein n=1 Tax=Glycine soja TaxID=3848 RepID=A0A445I4E4_GLYSO|nr:hypothetical protein D0Y65_030616 [Glycine soja]